MDKWIWIFHGNGGEFCSGAFNSRKIAEEWILKHSLSGTLTQMPIDTGVYDWAIASHTFEPKKEYQKTSNFIQKFTSASLEHYHYEDGIVENE